MCWRCRKPGHIRSKCPEGRSDRTHVTFTEPDRLGHSLELPQGLLGAPDQAMVVSDEPASQPSPSPVLPIVLPTRPMRLIDPPRRSVLNRLRNGGLPGGNVLDELNNYEYSDDDGVARDSAPYISTAGSEDEEGVTAILPSASPAPKLLWDCASTAHTVDNVDLLDDFAQSVPPTKVRWGTEGNMMISHGMGTLRTKNY